MAKAKAERPDGDRPNADAIPISTSDARNRFGDLINRVAYGREHVVLTRRGKDLVAIVPAEGLRWIEEFEDRRDAELAAEAIEGPEASRRFHYRSLHRNSDCSGGRRVSSRDTAGGGTSAKGISAAGARARDFGFARAGRQSAASGCEETRRPR